MARMVKVSTISFGLDPGRSAENALTVEDNLERASKWLGVAASRQSDVACLPECFGTIHTFQSIPEQAQPADGQITRLARARARQYRMNVIAPILERRGRKIYNTTYVFDRRGRVAGRYDKTHLPTGEREHATPGRTFPVIKTDFGRIGILTCYDLNFPEAARILKIKGAEIIFWPTMWSGPSDYFCEATLRVRAMENLVYFVSANYVRTDQRSPYRNSCIISWDGTILASTGPYEGAATAEIDLAAGKRMQASEAEMLGTHRRPEIYAGIMSKWRKRRA